MKLKNVMLMTFLITCIVTNVNAQSRKNRQIVEFKSKSAKLTKATGWGKNKLTGKWVECKNVIDDNKCPSNYQVSHVSQNFIWIQFATIDQNGQAYYIFLYEQLGGNYRYPNIYEGWEHDKRTRFFILTPSQYEEIKKQVDLKLGENIIVTSNMVGGISDSWKLLGGEHLYNEEILLANITNAIKKPISYKTCFIFNSQVVDGVEIVRFRLPEWSCDGSIKTKYFEVKISEFKTILTE